ncbi:c-type cytochrome [Bradyrhizobium sp. U87765 SZCCT0131]|uniref:cytochrome-c peroxidase n=1 Tax=unclassified Bradyrhizobium TaxID=2631580 RepID=UPI001BA672FF|nr:MULTISPECIES: cytochrome c peroxidase [unclassified Bradyrhizobium]MBR1218873.1 c-type cytochrome [Bradyrhizobium sp. U87765 SZCCT0131]MBR1261524.1 c-type cytochrome [Bradyrhizobium sp. U87765 SZCCT0134]MBR1306623.1 c-type cytochrome [Bradyrhizobium sp. U87765 SZCCT0110]MBR1317306.1 c-type cytochrome [Bradyrhizobium sp. U87765 SZCCT0109]MBR1351008.1 c-type cytochrome [Bradyrhizobium sp. U87765 SZCCT0048]
MRNWAGYSIAAAVLLALPVALIAADQPADPVAVRASYRRPATIPFPDSNPFSTAKHTLGEKLFFDPLLSGSRTISCASCHNPALSWSDGLPRAIGARRMPLRSPTLIDVAFIEPLGWDGKFADLESVTFGPLSSAANMDITEHELIKRLSAAPGYADAFARAYGDSKVTRPRIEQALATYQRTIVAGEAPFDRWIMGDDNAIGAQAKRGFALFNGKANCAACHSGPSFTDGSFHDIGTATGDDIGRGQMFPTSVKLRYAFKTPTLRDVARRPPYMHDGSAATLREVIDLYDRGGIDRPSRSPEIKPLGLTGEEKADLIAFLQTLDGAPVTPSPPPPLR